MIRHASNPLMPEHTLCGDAFDGGDSGDLEANPTFAIPGQTINCPQCRAVITWAKGVKNFREPPENVTAATVAAFNDI